MPEVIWRVWLDGAIVDAYSLLEVLNVVELSAEARRVRIRVVWTLAEWQARQCAA